MLVVKKKIFNDFNITWLVTHYYTVIMGSLINRTVSLGFV